jgi:SAM-dependent methyltransferase
MVTDYSFGDISVIGARKQREGEVQFYDGHLGLIEEECGSAKAVLDVGCGTGYLLERLRRPSLVREGVELNAERARMARETAGCPIHEVGIEQFPGEGRFDVILMINVLSHVPFLRQMLERIRALLVDGGRFVLQAGEMRQDVRRTDVIGWGIPDHVHFLGFDTLEYICREYGFALIKRVRVPYSQELFSVGRFRSPGRSRAVNAAKRAVVSIPFALDGIRWLYDRTHGGRVVSSFIVLRREERAVGTSGGQGRRFANGPVASADRPAGPARRT